MYNRMVSGDNKGWAAWRFEDLMQSTHQGFVAAFGNASDFITGVAPIPGQTNGRFDITTGRALGAPALVDLGCHQVRVADGIVQLLVGRA